MNSYNNALGSLGAAGFSIIPISNDFVGGMGSGTVELLFAKEQHIKQLGFMRSQ
jgi:hypothetical protein